MRAPNSQSIPWRPLLSELVGTGVLVLVGLSLVIVMFGLGSPIARVLPSEGLRRLITGFLFGTTGALIAVSPVGRISGAHINPVVTLGFWLFRKLDSRTVLGYVLAQLAGATLGAARILWKESGTGLKWGVLQFLVSIAGPGLAVLKYDGSRTGKRYTGHLVNNDGSLGALAQFRFLNDPGVESFLNANDYVDATPCPAWDANNAAWSGTAAKYHACLSPWGAWA